jgi:hypothetical protein
MQAAWVTAIGRVRRRSRSRRGGCGAEPHLDCDSSVAQADNRGSPARGRPRAAPTPGLRKAISLAYYTELRKKDIVPCTKASLRPTPREEVVERHAKGIEGPRY